jgi:phosphomethylpyrimidine synthase
VRALRIQPPRPIEPSLDPYTVEQYLDLTLPTGRQDRPLLLDVRPKFCSINITQEVRDFAAKQNQSADTFLAAAPPLALSLSKGGLCIRRQRRRDSASAAAE